MSALYLVGTTLAFGLVWFFALVGLSEYVFGFKLSPLLTGALLFGCASAGALVGWKLFVSRKPH